MDLVLAYIETRNCVTGFGFERELGANVYILTMDFADVCLETLIKIYLMW